MGIANRSGRAGRCEFKDRPDSADISQGTSKGFPSEEKSPRMKRISTLALGLIVLTWASGCCCCNAWYSRCVDYDDGCYGNAAYDANCPQQPCPNRRRNCRNQRCQNPPCVENCCPVDCCDPCSSVGVSVPQPVMPAPAVYETGALPGASGCSTCGSTTPTFGGLPIDPSSGWTVTPMTAPSGPVSSEPVQAPPAATSLTPIPTPATPASTPTPISPPAR